MKRKRSRRRWILPVLLVTVLVIAGACVSASLYFGEKLTYSIPEEYRDMVERTAAEMDVPPSLVFAVIRCESSFRADVVSHAGAVGLMQVTPDAFSWIQRKMKWDDGKTSDDLTDPQVNVRYGTALLSILLEEFGTPREALAAYNAGRGRVIRWLGESDYSSDGETLTVIPIEETRNYVERVEEARQAYQRTYHLR